MSGENTDKLCLKHPHWYSKHIIYKYSPSQPTHL